MSNDRRLFIGPNCVGEAYVPFLGSHNFDEANVIFWSPLTIALEFQREGHLVQQATYQMLQGRMSALAAWVTQGHTLVLIGSNTVPFQYVDNQNVGRIACLEQAAPLVGVNFKVATGARAEYCGPSWIEEVFRDQLPNMRYDTLISGDELTPLLRVGAAIAGAQQIIGGYRKRGLGLILYIPPFNGSALSNKVFLGKLEKLPALLRARPTELPNWVNAYQSASERSTSDQISKLEQASAQLNVQIAEEQKALASHRALKQLIAGTGASFANAVAASLRELGLDVVEGPHPRADLLSVKASRFIAIEAKGVEGGVREAQFRQTERWIAEVNSTVGLPAEEVSRDADLSRYAAQLAKLNTPFANITDDCKGLMVIGTYRTTPLADRVEADFPEPVLRLLSRSQVCALTGAQLFALVMLARENPALKVDILNELMGACGVLASGRGDWRKYLEKVG
jgi:hypothetical protein